jgi:hypothetical protein
MRINKLLSTAALALLGVTAIAQTAFAVPIAAKETSTGDIYISGLTGYQKLSAEYSALPKAAKKSANECGFFKLTATSTSAPIASGDSLKLNGGTAAVVSSLPLEAAPKCTNGALSGANLTPGAALRDAEGNVYYTGLTPYSQNIVTYVSLPSVRSVSSNTCGIAKLSNAGDYVSPTGTITVKDKTSSSTVATVTLASVPSVSGGPVCRNGVSFFANDWPTN